MKTLAESRIVSWLLKRTSHRSIKTHLGVIIITQSDSQIHITHLESWSADLRHHPPRSL